MRLICGAPVASEGRRRTTRLTRRSSRSRALRAQGACPFRPRVIGHVSHQEKGLKKGPADRLQIRSYNSHMAIPALNLSSLSPEEKLRLLEEVWESLAADPAQVPLVEWQRRELDRRLDEVDREGATGIPWERVLNEIEGRSR